MADLTAAEVVEMSVLHPRIKREQRDARILAMRGKGETLQAIGDELGLTRARIQQICADSKMPERDLLSWLEATAAYISTPLGMPALGKKISRVSATVADLIEDRDALLTREAALVAERDAALRSANIAEARVKGWEATVVITNLPSRIWPVEGWGPGEGETVAVPELTPKKLTDILDRLKAADAIADQRDALAAEVRALREDAELFQWMETHVAAWHCKEAALPRFVVDPRFADETGEEYSLIVTGVDGVGTVSLRTAIRMMSKSKTDAARAEAGHG